MQITYYELLEIIVPDDRQRSKLEIEDLLPSIKRRGFLTPIIVEPLGDIFVDSLGNHLPSATLIAGGRRLACALELSINIPARDVSDLSDFELKCIELEENIKRKDLLW